MIKSPIPKVTNNKQFRAIGIVFGMYKPNDNNLLNKGFIEDSSGLNIDAVVLGKALPLIKKFINFENKYYWIVYPRNKNSDNIHLQMQVYGIQITLKIMMKILKKLMIYYFH